MVLSRLWVFAGSTIVQHDDVFSCWRSTASADYEDIIVQPLKPCCHVGPSGVALSQLTHNRQDVTPRCKPDNIMKLKKTAATMAVYVTTDMHIHVANYTIKFQWSSIMSYLWQKLCKWNSVSAQHYSNRLLDIMTLTLIFYGYQNNGCRFFFFLFIITSASDTQLGLQKDIGLFRSAV